MSDWPSERPDDLTTGDDPAPETRSTDLVHPATGEIVDLADVNACATIYAALGDMETRIKDARVLVRRALVDHARVYGGDTMRIDAAEVKIGHPVEITWDLAVLRELRAAGLPDDRWNELVEQTVVHKVKATVAKQIAKANPVYAEIVGRAEKRHPKPDTVSVALRASS